jgi:MFS family permease
MSQDAPRVKLEKLPCSIWALGLVSMFMDISSEMIHALLPLYLVTVLGASTLTVGLIEGIAEATAMITKVFSGALSDWLGRRKLLAAVGYGLAAFTKPVFPQATSFGWIVAARFVDRIGKGIRGAPRDALVSDLSPAHLRGASYGLRQSLDTVGAFTGPLLAIALMALTANNFRLVFWIAVIPAFISFALIVFAVKEPERLKAPDIERPLQLGDVRRLRPAYWAVVAVASVLTLARFSEAFLVLRAQNVGIPIALVPAVLVVMNIIYALSAYPVGIVSDRFGRDSLMAIGVAFLIVADLVLALGATSIWLMVGTALWGLHMGLTQGLLATLVADTAPEDMRGTAFGIFNLISGIAVLMASIVAGALWDIYGPKMTFLAGAAFTFLALAGLLIARAGAAKRDADA